MKGTKLDYNVRKIVIKMQAEGYDIIKDQKRGVIMRPKYLNFEQLVNQNRQELLKNKDEMNEIELRIEKKQAELVNIKRQNRRQSS